MAEMKQAAVYEVDNLFKRFNLKPGRILGSGASGCVFLATAKDDCFRRRAVKLFQLSKLQDDDEKIKWFLNEVACIQKLNHPNLVRCIFAAKTQSHMYLCMKYYSGGTLRSVLPYLEGPQIDLILIQISAAVDYLHQRRMIHGDLKIDNVFLDSRGDAALGDFGHTKHIPESKYTIPAYLASATPGYEAPEIISKTSPFSHVNPFKLDSYMLGVVLWCMVFRKAACPKLGYKYLEMTMECVMPKFFKDCLLCLLEPQSDKRASIPDLLQILRKDSAHSAHLLRLERWHKP